MCHVVLSVAKYLFQMRFRDSSCRQNDKFAYCIDFWANCYIISLFYLPLTNLIIARSASAGVSARESKRFLYPPLCCSPCNKG